MSKHTPGPWKIGTAIDDQALAIFNKDAKIGAICDAVCLISPLAKVNETDEANANLICAAPELLDSLTTIVTFLKNNGFAAHAVYKKYIEEAQDIIIKATNPAIQQSNLLEKVWHNSSTVARTVYNEAEKIMFVEFKNGKQYQYNQFPVEEWQKLLQAESIGKYIHAHVKGNFQGILLD